MRKGLFITFEGCEGCGKTTQVLALFKYLQDRGYPVIHTREPGGTGVAEGIRSILLDPDNRIAPMAELLLYEAARAQHASDVIAPALKEGKIVICDRFTDATLAYQGYARGLDRKTIRQLNRTASLGLVPAVTIYLDIPVEKGLQRARSLQKDSFKTGDKGDRIEQEDLAFHKKVRKGYRALAKAEPGRIKLIPANDTIERITKKIIAVVQPHLGKTGK